MVALIRAKGTALFSSAKIVLYFFFFFGQMPFAMAQEYVGYRLSIGNIKIVEATPKHLTFKCNVVNTGREPITILKDKSLPSTLVVEVDHTTLAPEIKPYVLQIKQALNRDKLQLSPGQMIQNVVYKIPKTAFESTPQTTISESTAEPTNTSKSVQKPPTVEVISTSKSSYDVDLRKECPDLVFDSVFIVSTSKKSVVLGFIIRNIGGTPAQLYGQDSKGDDNLAVNIYFVRGERISKGTLLANGVFLPETKDNKSGLLPPGKRVSMQIEVNTEEQTKFTPNFAFELDPFQTVFECDKTNNVKILKGAMSSKR